MAIADDSRMHRWIERLNPQVLRIALLCLIAVAHTAVLWNWLIEDAAISMAYARNAAQGEGLVPTPGGERVEGYSNPLWVALMVPFAAVGLDLFLILPWLSTVITGLTIPVVYWAVQEAMGKNSPESAAAATLALALNAQFAIWGGSGLENGLFCLLMATAIWRSLVELRTQQWPVSAFMWCLLAMTRPEGIAYAAIGGASFALWTLHDKRSISPTMRWLLTFWGPFLGYHLIRYLYFAYPFPQTYYGKLGTHRGRLSLWSGKGWTYVQDYAHELGTGYALPILAAGVSTIRSWRGVITLIGCAVLAVAVLLPQNLPDGLPMDRGDFPRWWSTMRPLVVAGFGLTVTGLSLGTRAWQLRSLCALLCSASVVFAIYANGDWMKGFRWLSLMSVPLSILFGLGTAELSQWIEDRLPTWAVQGLLVAGSIALTVVAIAVADLPLWPNWARMWRDPKPVTAHLWLVLLVTLVGGLLLSWAHPKRTARYTLPLVGLLCLWALPNIGHTSWFLNHPETTPWKVKKRVDYKHRLMQTLHLFEPVRDLDVDMGAHLWWSSNEMRDIAGLVDIPLAQHRLRHTDFLVQYLLDEEPVAFAHLHGAWGRASRLPRKPTYYNRYVQVPPYISSKRSQHGGTFVRRALLAPNRWDPTHAAHVAAGPMTIEGATLGLPWTPGRRSGIVVGLRPAEVLKVGDKVELWLSLQDPEGNVLHLWALPTAQGWLPPQDWDPETVVLTHGDLRLPSDIPPGTYDLGITVLHNDEVAPSSAAQAGPSPQTTVIRGALQVQSLEQQTSVQSRALQHIHDAAGGDDCEGAIQTWHLALLRTPRDMEWREREQPAVSRSIAECFANRATAQPTESTITALMTARSWDHWSPTYRARKTVIADALYAMGQEAKDQGDLAAALTHFSQCVRVDRTRSWARRYAEEARAEMLNPTRKNAK